MAIFVRSSRPYVVSTKPGHDPRIRQARKAPAAATATSGTPAIVEKRASVCAASTSRPDSARIVSTRPDQPAQPGRAGGHVDDVPRDEDRRRGEGAGVADE